MAICSSETATIRLKGLRPETVYQVTSVDAGLLGAARGSDLMGHGVVLQSAGAAFGHIVVLTAE